MEREERWIATVREKLRGADESLPEGGWEALERDLAAAGRRRRAFTPAWKKIAAVAAVVAIAVLIGETVVNQGVVDGDRQTTFFAGELTTADGQLLYDDEPLRNEALTALSEAPAPLVAKVRQALAESRPAAIVAADGSVQTLSGDALAEVRSSRSETEAAAPSDAEPSAAGEEAVAEEKEAQPAAKAPSRVRRSGRSPARFPGKPHGVPSNRSGCSGGRRWGFSPPDCRRRSRCRRGGRRRWLRLRPLMCSVRAAFSE